MPKVTMEFNLPDEQGELDYAMKGREALSVLCNIESLIRSHLKHGEPADDRKVLEQVRAGIVQSGLAP